MNKVFKTMIGWLFTACAVTSCTGNEEIQLPEDCSAERMQLQFVMHEQLPDGITRTSQPAGDGYATSFSDGDKIGIFVYNASDGDGKDAGGLISADVKYSYNADTETWSPHSGTAITLPRDWTKLKVYAYYPALSATVHEDYKNIRHSVMAAQAKAENYAKSDFMVASLDLTNDEALNKIITINQDGVPTVTAPLVFSHVCALLEVTVNSQAVPAYAGVQPTVTLLSAKCGMTVDLSADRTSPNFDGFTNKDSEKANVTMFPIGDGDTATSEWKFCAVVPQQSILKGAELLDIVFRQDGGEGMLYKYTLPTDQGLSLPAGKIRRVNVTIEEKNNEQEQLITDI